jgi:hypothetical protein
MVADTATTAITGITTTIIDAGKPRIPPVSFIGVLRVIVNRFDSRIGYSRAHD